MLGYIVRTVVVALGLWLATLWVKGIWIDTPATLLLAGLLLGIVNAVVRPVAVILTLPITLLTLGLFLLVINAAMVGLVAWLLPGMRIDGFGAAFWTALIVSIVSMIGSWFIGPKGRFELIIKKN
jgi:putative membrane protein